jgi:hypothetical protein
MSKTNPLPFTQIRLATHGRSIQLGQKQKWLSLNGMSALPSRADVRRLHRHIGFVPNSDVTVPMENSVAYQLARNVPVPA